MPTGGTQDIVARLKSLLPPWFGQASTPVLDAVLTGFASVAAGVYSLTAYATLQTRIATATDGFLDLISLDYFGRRLQRVTGESDVAFCARIQNEIFRPRITVAAISKVLTDLTGRTPEIFEPARPLGGGYGIACGYNAMQAGPDISWDSGPLITWDSGGHVVWDSPFGVGAYGSPNYPGQIFVIAYRPQISFGAPGVDGYSGPIGGYGIGAIEYVSTSSETGYADDAHIYAAIESVRPAGVEVWVLIQN